MEEDNAARCARLERENEDLKKQMKEIMEKFAAMSQQAPMVDYGDQVSQKSKSPIEELHGGSAFVTVPKSSSPVVDFGNMTVTKPNFTKEVGRWQLIEERLRIVEGTDQMGPMGARELSLVSDLVIPPKFKVPDFDKYDGTKCPKAHATMYCRKMAACNGDDKLLIHYFQESLTGSALRGYNQLGRGAVQSGEDLARLFYAQYRHVIEMAPDRMTLQNMEKRHDEDFRQYAQRWRNIASQIYPPTPDSDLSSMFIHTLKSPYFENLLSSVTKNFADLIKVGELVETALKSGKLSYGETSGYKKNGWNGKKKEGEVQVVFSEARGPRPPYPTDPNTYPTINYAQTQPYTPPNPSARPSMPRPERQPPKFTPLPISYTELFPKLVESHLIAPVYVEPFKPPFPSWYDPEARCAYHFNVPGHTVERCTVFKRRVEDLVRIGKLNFNNNNQPNIVANPLPNHEGTSINAMINEEENKSDLFGAERPPIYRRPPGVELNNWTAIQLNFFNDDAQE